LFKQDSDDGGAGVVPSSVKKVKFADSKMEESAEDEDDDDDAVVMPSEILALQKKVLELLKPGETPQKALRRLHKATGNSTAGGGKKKSDPIAKAEPTDFDTLTEAVDKLLGAGQYNVYQQTYEHFAQAVGNILGASASSSSSAPTDDVQWEYKWSEDATDLYGPFSTKDMVSWSQQGFFSGESMAWIRQVKPVPSDGNSEEGAFQRSDTLRLDLLL